MIEPAPGFKYFGEVANIQEAFIGSGRAISIDALGTIYIGRFCHIGTASGNFF